MRNEQELNQLFWDELHKGNFNIAEQYLNEGADIENVDFKNRTPFRFFAANGRQGLKAAEWLLSKGANIDAIDVKGETALFSIINSRDNVSFEWILKHSPDVELRNKSGVSPLALACHMKNVSIVKNLVENGANPNTVSKLGGNPFLNAIGVGSLEIVKILMETGVDLTVKDSDGNTPYHVLPSCKNEELIHYVIDNTKEKIDANVKNNFDLTPIILMSLVGNKKGITFLLDNGADPNVCSTTYDNITPLMNVIQMKDLELMERMLSAGADPNAVNLQNQNVMYCLINAIADPKVPVEMILKMNQLLVNAGMDINAVPDNTGISIITASLIRISNSPEEQKENNIQLLKYFTQQGYAINPKQPLLEPLINPGEKGYDYNVELKKKEIYDHLAPTPLEFALGQRDLSMIDFLLQNGAKPNEIGLNGKTAMHKLASISVSSQESMAVKIIKSQKGIPPEIIEEQINELKETIRTDQFKILEKLVNAGGDVNVKDKDGVSPLTDIIMKGNFELAGKLYIDYGADPLQMDDYDDNAVTMSLKYADPVFFREFVYELEKQGKEDALKNILNEIVLSSPDDSKIRLPFLRTVKVCTNREDWVNNQDENGNTPLILAAATGQHDMVSVLIDMGANVNLQNNAGETALMQSFVREDVQTINKLVKSGAKVEIKNNEGKMLMNMASSGHQREILFNLSKLSNEIENKPAEEVGSTVIESLNKIKVGSWSNSTPKKKLSM